ncbi:MAG: YfbM family protein [Myxococcales bacterium]|nr:YfbM family protein [Myxococcales bacterium]
MAKATSLLLVSDRQITHLALDPDQVSDVIDTAFDADNDHMVYVDKAWHGVHYLFTGTNEAGEDPLNFFLTGGSAVGDDLGYGPARSFSSRQVASIAKALSPLDHDVLAARFNAQHMAQLDIYPGSSTWVEADPLADDSPRYWLLDTIDDIRRVINTGREHNLGMLVWMS